MLHKKLIENYIINNKNKLKINSNEITNGDIFLALQGNNYHGNKYIEASINNGAKFCLSDKKFHISLTFAATPTSPKWKYSLQNEQNHCILIQIFLELYLQHLSLQ